MSTLVSLTNGLQQVADVQAAGVVRAESIFDWTQNIATEAQSTINVVILVVASVVALFIMIKRKFTVGSVVIGLLVAGGATWVVLSGALWAKDRIQETTETGASDVQVVEPAGPGPLAGDLELPDGWELL